MDYYKLRNYLNKNSDPNYFEEKVHDGFVKSLYNKIYCFKTDESIEYYRGVKLIDNTGEYRGRIDLALLTKEEFIIVEAKVRRGKRAKKTYDLKKQLEGYYLFWSNNFGIKPRCFGAYKHQRQSHHFNIKEMPFRLEEILGV